MSGLPVLGVCSQDDLGFLVRTGFSLDMAEQASVSHHIIGLLSRVCDRAEELRQNMTRITSLLSM